MPDAISAWYTSHFSDVPRRPALSEWSLIRFSSIPRRSDCLSHFDQDMAPNVPVCSPFAGGCPSGPSTYLRLVVGRDSIAVAVQTVDASEAAASVIMKVTLGRQLQTD